MSSTALYALRLKRPEVGTRNTGTIPKQQMLSNTDADTTSQAQYRNLEKEVTLPGAGLGPAVRTPWNALYS